MPDITKCTNDKCNRKNECYRFTSKPSDNQSYADFDEKECEYFIN